MISETGHSYPAELFDDLLRECGGEALVNALDAHRSALAAWEAAERFRRGKAGLYDGEMPGRSANEG